MTLYLGCVNIALTIELAVEQVNAAKVMKFQ